VEDGAVRSARAERDDRRATIVEPSHASRALRGEAERAWRELEAGVTEGPACPNMRAVTFAFDRFGAAV
jgi:hypothetical protein